MLPAPLLKEVPLLLAATLISANATAVTMEWMVACQILELEIEGCKEYGQAFLDVVEESSQP